MKLFVLFTILTAVLISGCVSGDQQTPSSPTQPSTETTTTTSDSTTTGTDTQSTATSTSGTGDSYPSLSTTVGPSNPSLGETFTLTVSSEDDKGLVSLGWETSNYFSNQGPSDSFSCNSQKTCSNSWEFLTIEEGLHEIKITVVDTGGNSINSVQKITVGAYQVSSSSSTTTSTTPSEPTTTVTEPDPIVTISEDECSSNSDCGRKQVCRSGECKDVQCTTDSHCSGCKRCSSNTCRSCGSGPYGCYC